MNILEERIKALASAYEAPETLREQATAKAANFNRQSAAYDRHNHPGTFYTPDRLAGLVAANLPAPAGPVLDVACGTGLMGERLRALGHEEIVGVDLAEAMLDKAETKAVYRKLVVADLHAQLPFAPGSFAAVTCSSALHEGMLGVVALARVLPLLRPGGMLFADILTAAWPSSSYGRVLQTLADEGLLRRLDVVPGDLFSRDYLAPEIPSWEDQGVYVVAELA